MGTKKDTGEAIVIAAPRLPIVQFEIEGTAPYVQHKFSAKARRKMLEDQMKGSQAKSRKTREARDIEADYIGAMHVTTDGRRGIPAPAFRNAMVSACRLCGFHMTKAKLSVFVLHDDVDKDDGTPLVYIDGEPEMHETSVRLESGVASIAVRPMWRTWRATLRVRFDEGQFSHADVANLLLRAGLQVGVGEGRPDSKKSNGMGWGTFHIIEKE